MSYQTSVNTLKFLLIHNLSINKIIHQLKIKPSQRLQIALLDTKRKHQWCPPGSVPCSAAESALDTRKRKVLCSPSWHQSHKVKVLEIQDLDGGGVCLGSSQESPSPHTSLPLAQVESPHFLLSFVPWINSWPFWATDNKSTSLSKFLWTSPLNVS